MGSVTGAPLPDPPPPSGGSHDPPPPPPPGASQFSPCPVHIVYGSVPPPGSYQVILQHKQRIRKIQQPLLFK